MPDSLFADLPYPPPLALPPAAPLPKHLDDSLLQQATARWRESSQGLRELVAATPALRDSINELLRQQLNLDGEHAGLRSTATDTQPERFVCLTDACAFVLQHPTLEATVDLHSRVTGVPVAHPLATLKPLQMLELLKAMSTEQAHQARWLSFWDARARGTPVTQRERAIQLYRDHFEATAQVAFARRTLTAEQLKPLQQIIDTRTGVLTLDGQPIHTEQLALLLSNNSKVKLKGAWVISVGDPAKASPLLYLPSRPVAIQAFSTRQVLEDWLTGQALVPTGLPTKDLRFVYSAATDPMITGSSDLFADRQQAQISALRNANHGKPGLMAHGAQSLVQADLLDSQRRKAIIVALPPNPVPAQLDIETDEQSLFGSLRAAIPLSVRHAALKRARDALDALLETDGTGHRQQECKDALKALEAAEKTCDTAATALLYRARPQDLSTFNTAFNQIHQAHKDGLHAEATVQLALGQLDSAEHNLLKAILDTPLAAERDADLTVASLTLTMTETSDQTATTQTETLKGPLVVMRQAALLDADSTGSVLLYWPGSGGGLQRFANRRELEREVFKIQEKDPELALLLNRIDTDPLHLSLDAQISEFESNATALRGRSEHADKLEILRKRTLAALQVPVNAARNLTFAHVLEQDRSDTLATRLPGWLKHLSETDRGALKDLIQRFISAMHRSHKQLALALESRDEFTRKHLLKRLGDDFSIKGDFEVTLDLPESVKYEKRFKPAPGHSGYELVMVPSTARSKMTLVEFAQLNIDNTPSMQLEPLSLRLNFVQTEVTSTDATERQTLEDGITFAYLKRVIPELDLPNAYEKLIRDTFTGSVDESAYVREHRRECLIEPWQVMLKLQGEFAHLQKQISLDELQILNIAIDAHTAEAWHADNKRVVIRPAYLSAGGKDTHNEGPATLSGVTFIEEQVSGTTLLYLPDSPDERFLRRYDNLEAARLGLYTLCQTDKWTSYLAGRALQGTVRAHEGRIAQAVLKRFDAIIGVGVRWPATTSFAAHLLDAHMGRLIEAHRSTSRSNDALYMERYALKGPRAFNYIKMALGMLPFIGSALALYDAWTAANQAVAAFLRADVGDGLAEIESVLVSLIDAAMDLLPGEVVFSGVSRGVRSLVRARQARALATSAAAMHRPSRRQARHLIARFAGYEYQRPISLAGLEPGTSGLYRGVYRHADGDFIVRQGRIYEVQPSTDSRNWRLRGTSQKTYKQPIALDETGQWDTWFGVYGTTLEGGVLGGGNVIGHLADALDPLWPDPIRQRLPQWWASRTFRRHHQLTLAVDDLADQLQARGAISDALINKYASASVADRAVLQPAVEAACVGDIQLASKRYQTLVELMPLTHGNKQRTLIEMQSKTAWLITDRHRRRALHLSYRAKALSERIKVLSDAMDDLLPDTLHQRLMMLEETRTLRVQMVQLLEQMEALRGHVNLWYDRIRVRADKQHMIHLVEELNTNHSDANLLYLKTSHRLEMVKNYGGTDDLSWFYLLSQARELRDDVDLALYTQHNLPNIIASPAERSRILQNCLNLYSRFRLEMTIWTTNYPQHFHLDVVEPLLSGIERLGDRARRGIIDPPAPRRTGQAVQRVFTTADNQVLYGVEQWHPQTQARQYVFTGRGGYKEIWEQGADGKIRLTNPQNIAPPTPPQVALALLVSDAQRRLDAQTAYRATVESNADLGMLPVDLEHMMVSQAGELNQRANLIQAKSAQHPIIEQLRNKADELIVTGRSIRTQRSLTSQQPTDGMLQDLIDHDVVEIRRVSPLQNLTKTPNKPDHMQEYEIWDISLDPAQLLWYAHFHYRRPSVPFRDFEKAHLKLPEHRFVTRAENPDLPAGQIGRGSTILDYFLMLPDVN